MKRTAVLTGLAVVLAACGSPSRGSLSSIETAPAESADRELPPAKDFELPTFDGETFTLSDYEGRLPVVLNFWAPW